MKRAPFRDCNKPGVPGLFCGNNRTVSKNWKGLWAALLALWLAATMVAAAAVATPAPLAPTTSTESLALEGSSLVWVDANANRSIDDIARAGDSLPWERLQDGQKYHAADEALWIRFDATLPAGTQWRLVMMHPAVDLIRLYHQGPDGRWVTQQAGEDITQSEWPLPGRVPILALAPGTGEPVRYWVRIERNRLDFSVSLRLYAQASLLQLRDGEQLVMGGYFGVVILLLAGALIAALLFRDRALIAFALYVAGAGAWQFVNLGLAAQHLWSDPNWTYLARSIAPGLAAAGALWFIKVVTEPARFSRVLDFICGALIAALLAAIATNGFVGTRESNMLVLMLIGVEIPLAVVLLALLWRKSVDVYQRVFVAGFLPLLVAATGPVARGLSLIPSSALNRYGLIVGTAIQLPVLYYALTRRAARRRETGVRASELAHTDALTGLWDRATLLARMDDAVKRAVSQRHQCALLGVRLTNIGAIEAEMGRDVADRAMIVAASILRGVATDIDVSARTAHADFAVLLDGPTSAQAALSRAQQIVARGLQHTPVLPQSTELRFHVAVLVLPDHELDATRCAKWVDDALSAMRADPKRAIRSLNF